MNLQKRSVKVKKANAEKIEAIEKLFFQIHQKITLIKQFEKEYYLTDARPKFMLPSTQIRPMVANR